MHNNEHVDVVVVGGGFAGVAAARDASRAGLSVTLVEARDRLGGRTWLTRSRLGLDLEMGGAYVHWSQPHAFAEIVTHGLTLTPSPLPATAYWLEGDIVRTGTLDDLDALMRPVIDALESESRQAFPNPHYPFPLTDAARAFDQMSFQSRIDDLDLSEEQRSAVSSQWSLSFSGPISEGSYVQALRLMALTGTSEIMGEANYGWTITGGTTALLEAMHAESTATTVLDTTVTAIDQGPQGAVVHTDVGDTFTARHVIVTLPINALDTIEFTPPLSAGARSAARDGQTSRGFKVWMRAKGKIPSFIAWAPAGYRLNMVCSEYSVDGDSILLGFGSDAGQFDVHDISELQKAIDTWNLGIELTDADVQDWTNDPLSKQTWAMTRVGQLTRQIPELQAVQGCVRLAGADYANGWAGYIDGAIESGRRAAQSIVAGTMHTPGR